MKTRPPELTIDVSRISDDETLHEYLSKTLRFPGYYGFNWDAFWDCICSDEQSNMPIVLRIEGLTDLRRQAAWSANQLESCLNDYIAEFPDRSVVIV